MKGRVSRFKIEKIKMTFYMFFLYCADGLSEFWMGFVVLFASMIAILITET
jgi:hypothetical protein